MSMKNIDMKALCKRQHVYEGGGLVTGILMFLTITSHSSPLSHQQVGVTMPLSTALVRIGGGSCAERVYRKLCTVNVRQDHESIRGLRSLPLPALPLPFLLLPEPEGVHRQTVGAWKPVYHPDRQIWKQRAFGLSGHCSAHKPGRRAFQKKPGSPTHPSVCPAGGPWGRLGHVGP